MRFHNRYPEDACRILSVAVLEVENGKWFEVLSGKRRSASGNYIFVRIGAFLHVSKSSRVMDGYPVGHIDLAQGRSVDYAGEIQFSGRRHRGLLRFWTNGSGHYQPPAEAAGQASLPLDSFRAIEA